MLFLGRKGLEQHENPLSRRGSEGREEKERELRVGGRVRV